MAQAHTYSQHAQIFQTYYTCVVEGEEEEDEEGQDLVGVWGGGREEGFCFKWGIYQL